MSREEQAIAWLRGVLPKHLAASRSGTCFGLSVYTAEPYLPPACETHVDLDPEEGHIVEVNDGWILLRAESAANFFVCAQDLIDRVPPVGSHVRITPYARRGFDGKRLDTGDSPGGAQTWPQAIARGLWRATVPIDSTVLRSSSLLELIDQIVRLRAADGIRRLSHVLVDAGAALEPPKVVDANGPGEPASQLPSLMFRVRTQKADGWLRIECLPGLDSYRLQLLGPANDLVRTAAQVSSDILTSVIVEWIDDGCWRLAKVEFIGAHVN